MSYRVDSVFARCQEIHDHAQPPVEYCRDCGFEASVDCICTGEVIDIDIDEGYSGILGEG